MKKIFLVDDQPIANFITKKLLEVEGFNGEVRDFTDSTEAFEYLSNEDESLIFLDLNMPVMSGWDFLEELQKRNIKHQVIILSSSTSQFDIQKAKLYPDVLQYVVKPMNKQKFLELAGNIDYLKVS
ncbi:response regulator [Christiangramia flava]|uniref:Two-component response regulator n=1 Tax=Christiangramia flava JLT2011 TaxID=1229726 RepID=A0A1L7I6V1_9FLAO|nr:response regulator [Christiangramia flava]APU69320.1 Two-component response regulator [Christiangramia flava JLT2011]OSS38781.1 response regulator [Christiangramia flava JLT2011]